MTKNSSNVSSKSLRNPITHPVTNKEFLASPLFEPLQPYLWVQDSQKPVDYQRASPYRLANPSWLVQDPVRLSKALGLPYKSISVSVPRTLPELSLSRKQETPLDKYQNYSIRRSHTKAVSLCFIRIDLLVYLNAIALGVIPHGINRNDIPKGTLSKLYLAGQGAYANQAGDTDYEYYGMHSGATGVNASSTNSAILYDDTLSTVLQTGDLSILTNLVRSLLDEKGPYYLAAERTKPHHLWFFYNSLRKGVPMTKDALRILDEHSVAVEQQNVDIYEALGNPTLNPTSSFVVKANRERAAGKNGFMGSARGLPNLCHFIPSHLTRFLLDDIMIKKDIHNRLGMGLQASASRENAASVLIKSVSVIRKLQSQAPYFAKRLLQQELHAESLGNNLTSLANPPVRSLPGETPTTLTELTEELTKAFGATLDRGLNERYPTMASLGLQSVTREGSCLWIPRNIAADMIADEIEGELRLL